MRIASLQAGSRGPVLDVRDARGLVGFVSEDDPLWGELLGGLRAAFASRGRHRGPGAVVEGAEGAVRVGSRAFESQLESVVEAHGLRREEYAALWFGDGSAGRWLATAGTLLAGPVGAGEIREDGGLRADGELKGGSTDDAPGGRVARLARDARSEVERLMGLQDEVEGLEARLRDAREEATIVRGDAEAATMAWARERQDAETRLLLYRDRERELRGQLRSMERAGRDGPCGRCGRELGDRAEQVRDALAEEWESVVQDGRWWRRRRDQLEGKPDDVQAAESRAVALSSEVDTLAEELARRKTQVDELEAAARRLDDLLELAARLRGGVGTGSGAAAAGEERRARLLSEMRRRVRARIHGKVVALTGGRLLGAFPDLFAAWGGGAGRGGEDVAVLEMAARMTLVELAVVAGVKLDSVVFPDRLDDVHREDRPRVVEALARLAREIPLVLVHASPRVAAAAPERFDFLYRRGGAAEGGRIRRRRSGLGAVWLGRG